MMPQWPDVVAELVSKSNILIARSNLCDETTNPAGVGCPKMLEQELKWLEKRKQAELGLEMQKAVDDLASKAKAKRIATAKQKP